MKLPTLWLCVGIPGSGKSTWLKKHCENNANAIIVSRDEIRFNMLGENENYFAHEKAVFAEFIKAINLGLEKGYDVFVDATHINWPSRHKLLNRLNTSTIRVGCLVFRTPLDMCLARNNLRSGREKVPEDVIRNMYRSMTHPVSDPYNYDIIKDVFPSGDTVEVGGKE